MKNKILFTLVVVNLALVLAPLLAAMPFIAQTPAMLAIAYTARTTAPAISAVSAVAAAALLIRSWKAAPALVLLLGCAVLSRVNYLEWVFAPAGSPQTEDIGEFQDVRDGDMVIGVVIGNQSRAYPVRYLAHHHMLNDTLGATALLPTY